MSAFEGRRAPNASHYISTLNSLQQLQQQQQQQQEAFGLEDDLALFTNAQFFDFDMGENHTPVDYSPEQELRARRESAAAKHGVKGIDFLNCDYQFPEFAEFQTILGDGAVGVVPILDQSPPALSPSITASLPLPPGFVSSSSGDKRKADSIVDSNHAHSLEGASRIAAEEDKRRRNTAASARFRVKKKQREQALERTAKEMTDKCSRLEARIGQLEMENKWLKNLITEKNENKDDIAELWRKFNRDSNSEQKASDRLDSRSLAKAEAD